jgi:hypothetical protein
VLEFGSGLHSTPLFLNRSAFPNLESLHSIESDAAWITKVQEATNGDPRLQLEHVPEPIESAIEELTLEDYDLVLVDSSSERSRRAATIGALAKVCPSQVVVVIHDFEIDLYRKAATGFPHRIEFRAFNPCTGVCYGHRNVRRALSKTRKIVNLHANLLAPDDVGSWCETFRRATS